MFKNKKIKWIKKIMDLGRSYGEHGTLDLIYT